MRSKRPVVCATADLHGWLPAVPPCDLLLIAGDLCPAVDQASWLDTRFRDWLRAIPAAHVVATWGNNDFIAERGEVPDLPCTFLVDELISRTGLRIYGTAWTSGVSYQAWALQEEDDVLAGLAGRLPQRLDILLSHVPPFGLLDEDKRGVSNGSRTLLGEIERVRPAVTICGHVHAARGRRRLPWGGWIHNVAALDTQRHPHPDPVVGIDLPSRISRRREAAKRATAAPRRS